MSSLTKSVLCPYCICRGMFLSRVPCHLFLYARQCGISHTDAQPLLSNKDKKLNLRQSPSQFFIHERWTCWDQTFKSCLDLLLFLNIAMGSIWSRRRLLFKIPAGMISQLHRVLAKNTISQFIFQSVSEWNGGIGTTWKAIRITSYRRTSPTQDQC